MNGQKRYAVIWSDGFTSTFHETKEDAEELIEETEEIHNGNVTGNVVTIEEYFKRKEKV